MARKKGTRTAEKPAEGTKDQQLNKSHNIRIQAKEAIEKLRNPAK
jgi:hypothetical protein